MGSGSTGKAAMLSPHGVSFVGIEREAEYYAIAQVRIADAASKGPIPHIGTVGTPAPSPYRAKPKSTVSPLQMVLSIFADDETS